MSATCSDAASSLALLYGAADAAGAAKAQNSAATARAVVVRTAMMLLRLA